MHVYIGMHNWKWLTISICAYFFPRCCVLQLTGFFFSFLSLSELVGAVVAVFLMAMLYEGLKTFREWLLYWHISKFKDQGVKVNKESEKITLVEETVQHSKWEMCIFGPSLYARLVCLTAGIDMQGQEIFHWFHRPFDSVATARGPSWIRIYPHVCCHDFQRMAFSLRVLWSWYGLFRVCQDKAFLSFHWHLPQATGHGWSLSLMATEFMLLVRQFEDVWCVCMCIYTYTHMYIIPVMYVLILHRDQFL